MTKFQKKMLTIAAAGALTAVTALPAMAFENEFHGSYSFNTVFSNFNNGGSGDFFPGTAGWSDKRKMNNYFEQRARLQYIAKASDDLKLVTHFEIDNRFGQQPGVTRSGTQLDTDSVNIEVKHAYLDFNMGKSFNVKTGMMPYEDTLKGLLITADVPAVVATTKLGAYNLILGFSRFADTGVTGEGQARLGDANKDLFIMDNKFSFSKDTNAALSYYFLADYSGSPTGGTATVLNYHTQKQAVLLHTLGLSGATKLGPVALSGFAAMQAGHMKADPNAPAASATNVGPTPSSVNFHGWAANVAAKAKMGPGTVKTAFLFTSGDNNRNDMQYRGWLTSSVNSYNEGGMTILTRNTANSPTSTDGFIRRNVTNIALLSMGYDAKFTEKFGLDTNVGFGWAPASKGAPTDKKSGMENASDFMGAEINMTAGYQLYKNLKLQAQAGYLILGGYYKNSTYKNGSAATAANAVDPENPYTMRLQARYSF